MNGKNLFLASLIGGVVIAALSNIPIISIGNCLLCMWVWLGGIFAAWLYKRFNRSLTTGQGAGVGALAGLIGSLIGVVVGLLGAAGMTAALDSVSQMLGPDVTGGLDLGALAGPMAVVSGLVNVVLYTIFGAVGGLIGGAIFKSKAETVVAYTPPPAPVAVPPAYVAPVVEPEAAPYVEPVLAAEIIEPEVTEAVEALPEALPEELPALSEEPPVLFDTPDEPAT